MSIVQILITENQETVTMSGGRISGSNIVLQSVTVQMSNTTHGKKFVRWNMDAISRFVVHSSASSSQRISDTLIFPISQDHKTTTTRLGWPLRLPQGIGERFEVQLLEQDGSSLFDTHHLVSVLLTLSYDPDSFV